MRAWLSCWWWNPGVAVSQQEKQAEIGAFWMSAQLSSTFGSLLVFSQSIFKIMMLHYKVFCWLSEPQFYTPNDCQQKWCLDMNWGIVYIPWNLHKVSEFAGSLSKVISKHVWLAAKSWAAQSESETSVQQDLFNKYSQRLIVWLLWRQVLVFDSSARLKGWSKCDATEGGEEHFVTSCVVVKWLPAAKLMGTAVW